MSGPWEVSDIGKWCCSWHARGETWAQIRSWSGGYPRLCADQGAWRGSLSCRIVSWVPNSLQGDLVGEAQFPKDPSIQIIPGPSDELPSKGLSSSLAIIQSFEALVYACGSAWHLAGA